MIFGQKLDFLEFFKVCGILNFLAEEIVVLVLSFLFYTAYAYAGHGTLCTSIGFNFVIIDNGSWIPLSLHISQFVLCCIRGCHQRKPAASGHKVRLSIRGFVCNSRILSIRGFVYHPRLVNISKATAKNLKQIIK